MIRIYALLVCVLLSGVRAQAADTLWNTFQNPPAEAKPFVRWWWNGNCVTSNEIVREIGVMRAAGIGGFEINPIALPLDKPPADTRALEWLSPEWNQMVKVAAETAQQKGMVADVIVGSGWPFGGEFLKPGEMTQRIYVNQFPVKGEGVFRRAIKDLIAVPETEHGRAWASAPAPHVAFVRLAPANITDIAQTTDLTSHINAEGVLSFDVPAGQYVLQVGAVQEGFVSVVHGAPGAKGPVLDHFNAKVVAAYLTRMSDSLGPVLGGKLGPLVRAAFCDSIELAGANWTGDFAEQFQKRRGYDLVPFLPYVVNFPRLGKAVCDESPWGDSVRRVRYDFSRTLVELFHERFTQTLHAWCHAAGIRSRFQSYGTPWLIGMLDGYLIPDIPESNNWLFSDPDKHGFLVWTKYTSSGGHLAGRPIISTEAMTNTRGVFKATTEIIKAADDMNFVMGINHSVLHGFNYSPPEAGFPGWVRYGAYFSEQNSWWPQFKLWTAYNARLSAVFQATRTVVSVAILAPEADLWSNYGLERNAFHLEPWYVNQLWKALSCAGCNPDYLNENVVQAATFDGGKLHYGPMAYEAVIVAGAQSLQPATAQALDKFAKAGGRIVFAGAVPMRAPALRDVGAGDATVQRVVQGMLDRELDHDEANVLRRDMPPDAKGLLAWSEKLLTDLGVKRSVKFNLPGLDIYTLQHRDGERDLFFLVNTNAERAVAFRATFNTTGRSAWRWNPEQGTRELFANNTSAPLAIELQPLESVLLVFEPEVAEAKPVVAQRPDEKLAWAVPNAWSGEFHPIRGKVFARAKLPLADLGKSKDVALRNFGGTVVYRCPFNLDDVKRAVFLDLGVVKGISEVQLNGQALGTRWYGKHVYATAGAARQGQNTLEVRVTVPLYNYVRTLKNEPAAVAWTNLKSPSIKTGLIGPVRCAPAVE